MSQPVLDRGPFLSVGNWAAIRHDISTRIRKLGPGKRSEPPILGGEEVGRMGHRSYTAALGVNGRRRGVYVMAMARPSVGFASGDMDALRSWRQPILPLRQPENPGRIARHVATTVTPPWLLGGGKIILRRQRNLSTAPSISSFQPADEGRRRSAGHAERRPVRTFFPCNAVVRHAIIGQELPVGKIHYRSWEHARAGGAFFDITITGKGAHGAHPHLQHRPGLWSPAILGHRPASIVFS